MLKGRCHFLGSNGTPVVTFAQPDTSQFYPLQDKLQVLPGNNTILGLPGCFGKLKSSFFQTLMENAKTIPFKKQQLTLVTLPVEKNKYVAGQRVLPQLRPDQSTQAIETLPHIGGALMQIITTGRG
jgi:hypothetical protein